MNLGLDGLPGGGDDNLNFGDGQDVLQAVNDMPLLIARIQSIAIKGNVFGSLDANDHFGFVAEQIGQLKIAGQNIALSAGPGNDGFAIPLLGDMNLKEVI